MKTEVRYTTQRSRFFGVASLLDDAWRLERFTPPFAFGAFFSPEDTLLCVCAADAARELLTEPSATDASAGRGFRVAELTSGSGLVGFYLLDRDSDARLLGLDINEEAAHVAERNALILGLADRARFAQSDLWSPSTLRLLEVERPQMIVCNPPYVPEPPGTRMQIEAGAGPNGTAHVLRAIELTELVQPDTLALSWCSLSDPAAIAEAAEASGYELCALFVTAIADGEYSGSVHSYLYDLADSFINEQSETLAIIAPDGSASFAYLLLAGAFRRRRGDQLASSVPAVEALCQNFARHGVRTLGSVPLPVTRYPLPVTRHPLSVTRRPLPDSGGGAGLSLHCSVLTRWDELQLRVMLHGEAVRRGTGPA
jgi:methylase of polypeptide subunit release factors